MAEPRRVDIGPATLWCGDVIDILPRLDPADHLTTDPPYCSGGLHRGDRVKNNSAKKYVSAGVFSGDAMDQRGFASFTAGWMRRLPLRDGAFVQSFIDWRNLPAMTDAFQWSRLVWRGLAVWDKGPSARAPGPGWPRHQAEFVVWGTRGPMPMHGRGCHPGVYRHAPLRRRLHPVQKPVALLRELVDWAPHGATVLDPFMGSGSTGVACLVTGRRFVGVEIDETIFDTACARIAALWARIEAGQPPVADDG